MGTIYKEEDLKNSVLNQVNTIKGLQTVFTTPDADEAYNEAVRECGFICPVDSDTDKAKKYQWLLQRMRRWFLYQLYMQYILKFKSGDAEAQQIASNLQKAIDKLDKDFETAKANDAELFVDSTYFGEDLVLGTGLIEDRVGQQTEDRT